MTIDKSSYLEAIRQTAYTTPDERFYRISMESTAPPGADRIMETWFNSPNAYEPPFELWNQGWRAVAEYYNFLPLIEERVEKNEIDLNHADAVSLFRYFNATARVWRLAYTMQYKDRYGDIAAVPWGTG